MNGSAASKRDKTLGLLGNRQVNRRDVVFACEVGSTVHGIGVGDQDDLDVTAVRVEPWDELILGVSSRQSMMFRTADKGARSGPGDLDINVYTVRRWASLLGKLNPSVLATLFVPDDAVLVDRVGRLRRDLVGVVVSKEAAARYLGYMRNQLERWQGVRGNKGVSRPELVEAFGFDTKYAAHIIRLGMQGAEFLRTGRIPIPLPAEQAEALVSLRTGGMSESKALEWADRSFIELREAEAASRLPEKPSWPGVVARVSEFYRSVYEEGRSR